ncbi:MAG: FGGY-family carbohydrate kinase [bacterium]
MECVLGIDVGTQGVRTIASDIRGDVLASSQIEYGRPAGRPFFDLDPSLPRGWGEQDPRVWWDSVVSSIRDVLSQLRDRGVHPEDISALSADSTSGTIIPVDKSGLPLRKAIMYNDTRSVEEADLINDLAVDHCRKHGYHFNASFGLPKILWLRTHEPQIFEGAELFLHATDYIIGHIAGDFSLTDCSSALKTGCDLFDVRWPEFIRNLGIPLDKLPRPVMPGHIVGRVSSACAEATGLSQNTKVVAGASDGTAAFLASGASRAGDFNTTLGTTLVLKGISDSIVEDERGRVYSHRHPSGGWLPGGASNTGGECISKNFGAYELEELNSKALENSPSGLIIYPLVRRGERMPFADPNAEGFIVGTPQSREQLYAGYLEGVAFVERLSLLLMEQLGAHVGDRIFATGGGVRSREWLQIRADVLGKRLVVPKIAESAFGGCILAAGAVLHDVASAVESMVKIDSEISPREDYIGVYSTKYEEFVSECEKRGYSI